MSFEEINLICDEIAQEEAEQRMNEYADELEEELMNLELEKQYEMMSYSAELENFSPFDTINS